MKTYIKPAVTSTDIEMESVITTFSVIDKGTDSEALTQKKHGWSSDQWTKLEEGEDSDTAFH